jgi:hypothetical protein
MTFDINDRVGSQNGRKTYKDLPNIDFYLGDCLKFVDYYINCPLIFLDIDPHEEIIRYSS